MFAPLKEKVVREIVTEWQEPTEEIKKHPDYIYTCKQVKALNLEKSCCLEFNRFIMVNTKGLVRDFTDRELEISVFTREEIRGVR